MAHELIHAYRDVHGMSINYQTLCSAHENCALEECLVVGLHNSRSMQYYQTTYTENLIRKENGLKNRTKYKGW